MTTSDQITRPGAAFKPGREAARHLAVTLCFGLACGCFFAVMNNYLAERVGLDERGRGMLEFFRETPGLLLAAALALLAKRGEWWILKLALAISATGMAGLCFAPPHAAAVTVLIMLWSLGEHLMMPVRSSITLHLARPGQEGRALGAVGGLGAAGIVAGSLAAAAFFHFTKPADLPPGRGFSAVFAATAVLLLVAAAIAFSVNDGGGRVRRERLLLRKKFAKFYGLEVFYGARKQVFLTFAPFMLIKMYGMGTEGLALLAGVCAAANIVCAPLAGKITDRFGFRAVMVWDTVALAGVCLLYGFAGSLFPRGVAFWVVCMNFVLDAVISNASMASNIYARELSASREELTATLSTGISVNHLVSVLVALSGGWMVEHVGARHGLPAGYGALFSLSAFMAVMNTLFALTIPKPVKSAATGA